MFRLVFKHQGKRYSFDEDSGALEELARQLKQAAGGASAEVQVVPTQGGGPASTADANGGPSGRGVPGQASTTMPQLRKFTEGGRKGPPPQATPTPRRPAPPDGRFFWIEQRYLVFGSDARIPRRSRPLMLLRDRRGPMVPVLPCTSGGPKHTTTLFYRIEWSRWFTDNVRSTWLYRRYESVNRRDFGDPTRWELPRHELEIIGCWLRGEDAK